MDNWTHSSASRHAIAPISHTRPSPRSHSYYSFPVPLRVRGWVQWVGLSTQQVSNLLKVACSGPGASRTRNLSVTSPILYHYTTAPTNFHDTVTNLLTLTPPWQQENWPGSFDDISTNCMFSISNCRIEPTYNITIHSYRYTVKWLTRNDPESTILHVLSKMFPGVTPRTSCGRYNPLLQ